MITASLLPQAFYSRPAEVVAPDLLGRLLCRDGVVMVISEVEAYGGQDDTASHCRFGRNGRTARNEPMWGPGGHCYVYLCYGVHWMLNIVTGHGDQGSAVLVRSCEVMEGMEVVMERRRAKRGADICHGPGKVAQALDVADDFNGHPLFEPGGLELHQGVPPTSILREKRIGIAFADAKDRNALLRFVGVWE